LKKAFFFDRDGVINVEIGYLHEAEKTILLPGVADAVKLVHQAGFMAIVITNQSGVAKKMYPESNIFEVHARIQNRLLAQGGPDALIDAWYYCPHDPDITGECSCRKPFPGMLLRAAENFDIDLDSSFMIGDRILDLQAGRNAGCRNSCLVKTGYDPEYIAEHVALAEAENFPVAENIMAAVERLLKDSR
jgi:D-glycero-D-manno-heptose 1,7-bisphosphate phosphatase